MNWTQEQRDELVRLWDGGRRSYSEMAEILCLRRNQVVGRMRREKKLRGLHIEDRFSHPTRCTTPVPDESRLASIIDVTGCKWPVKDDPEFIGGIACCNHETGGSVYCEYHRAINVASYSRTLIRKTTHSALKAYLKRAA